MTIIRPMLCRKVKSLDDIHVPCWLSPKLNGIRAVWNPSAGLFQSKHEKFWPSWMTQLIWDGSDPRHHPKVYLDGEFLLPNLQALGTAIGINRHRPGPHAEQVTFNVFDMVALNTSVESRIRFLNSYFSFRQCERVRHVHHYYAGTHKAIVQLVSDFLLDKYEGVVARPHESLYIEGNKLVWRAYKFQTDEEVVIVSCHEAVGNLKGLLGGFTVRRPNDSATFDVACSAFTHAQRQILWIEQDSLIGKQLTIRYPYTSTTNVPLQAQCVAIRDYEQ